MTATKAAPLSELRTQHVRILWLLSEGLTEPEIATRLFLGRSTIHTHVRRMCAYLGARNHAHAVAIAYRYGYLEYAEHFAESETDPGDATAPACGP